MVSAFTFRKVTEEGYQQVKYQEIFSDIQAAIAYLKTLPNVKNYGLGAM